MQRIMRFARYWDLIANSGRFRRALALLVGATPFDNFMALSDWLYATTQRTHALPLEELHARLHVWMTRQGMSASDAAELLTLDYADSGARGRLTFASSPPKRPSAVPTHSATLERQRRHVRA